MIRFAITDIEMQRICEKRKVAAKQCNRLAEKNADIKEYVKKRYGNVTLS